MKKFTKSYRHLIALTAILLLAWAVFNIGLSVGRSVGDALAAPILMVGCWQLSQFAMSKRHGFCFLAGLTAEQVKEFDGILKDIAAETKNLSALPGRLEEVEKQLTTLRRLNLSRGERNELRPGQVVTDDCAEYLAALAIVGAEKKGKLELLNPSQREALLTRSSAILGIKQRSALTSSDIPLPVVYGAQVVALVNLYGDARRYGTVFPLGAGTVKLPRLKTDTAFGLLTQSTAISEKSPQTEWVTFTAEKFGGLVRLPTEIDEDSIVGLGQFLAEYCARNLAQVEDHNFFVSTGAGSGANGSVKGLCFSTIDNSKVSQMGSTKTHYSDATLANLRALRAVPDSSALKRGAYYMHSSFEQLLSTFNTAGDRPYNPNAQLSNPSAAQPFVTGPTLDGFPVRWVDIMPAYSTSANASKVFILFGDLKYQYLGVRGGIRMDNSQEAAFETDEILLRAIERLTIGLMATGAVAGLETAAS